MCRCVCGFLFALCCCACTAQNYESEDKSFFPNQGDVVQQMDIYSNNTPDLKQRPVLFFIHGGAWCEGDKSMLTAAQCNFFVSQGFVVVSSNYTLASYTPKPDDPGQGVLYTALNDLAHNLKWVRDNISVYGGNGRRIYLMGHSAGAHLAALLAVDPQYLQRANLDRRAIKAVCCLDGGPYMGPVNMLNNPGQENLKARWITAVGSKDSAIWQSFVPTYLIKGQGYYPAFLFIYSSKADYRYIPNQTLAAKLATVHCLVEQYQYPWDHYDFLKNLGTGENPEFNSQIVTFGLNHSNDSDSGRTE